VGEFNPQALANTAWAFATAGHAAPALFDSIATEAAPRVGKFSPQGLANTAWSFASTDTLSSAALGDIFRPEFGRMCDALEDVFPDEGLS
jgi:hypothetical protein